MNTLESVKRIYFKKEVLILFCLLLLFSCTKEKETQHDYPRVVTGLVTNINSDEVTFKGSFLKAGSSEIIDHGFVFSTSSFLDIRFNRNVSLGASTGEGMFTATVKIRHIKGETYYVSAYARNKDKIFYAEAVSFIFMGDE